MLKIKANKMNDLKKLGFVENSYPKNYFVLGTDIAIEPDRRIVVLNKQGEQVLKYLEKLDMVEKVVEDNEEN